MTSKDPAIPVLQPSIASDPVIDAYKKDVDRSLLRSNLQISVEQRLRQLMELQRFAEELRRAGKLAKTET